MISEMEFGFGGLTLDQMNEIVERLGGSEEALRFLRGEKKVIEPSRWSMRDGIIYFSVTSDGTTGPEWVSRLETRGFRIRQFARTVLQSRHFVPTCGVKTEVAVLPGTLIEDQDRVTKKILSLGAVRGFRMPNPEISCLIREAFTDEQIGEMGLSCILPMHRPIDDALGYETFLGAYRGEQGRWLWNLYDHPGRIWGRGVGFAFVAKAEPAPHEH